MIDYNSLEKLNSDSFLGSEMTLITIGMTCFNSAATIAAAINSALQQDWKNFELLIVDDGSSDESVGIIQKEIENYRNARLIVHPQNKGFAGALNTLIAEASGKYLAIFDDDDQSQPNRLKSQFKRLEDYSLKYGTDNIVCHSARLQKYPNGAEFYEQTAGCVDGLAPHGVDMADRILIGRLSNGVIGSCANCSRMAPLSVFKKMGGFDETMRRCEDTDFNVRFALSGGHFLGIHDPLVIQTMTNGNDKTLDREYVAERIMIQKHKKYLSTIGWYDFSIQWQDVKYANLAGKKSVVFTKICSLFISSPIKTLKKIYWACPSIRTRLRLKAWYALSARQENK